MRLWINPDPQERIDPRLSHMRDNNQENSQSTFTRLRVWDTPPWVNIRCSLIVEQWATGISSPRSEEHEYLLHRWTTHYWRQIIKEQQDLFPQEDLIEQYLFNQWKFALNNTYYAVNDKAWQNEFNRDFSSFPRHLGMTWHIGRSPQEIYEMARKIIATCLDITPNSGKFEACPEHLRREVSKCVKEISQQAV